MTTTADLIQGPPCQSCGMHINRPFNFGTEKDGFHTMQYCRFCYKKGKFTDDGVTLEQMIEKAVPRIVKMEGVPEDQARNYARETIPTLKRWRKPQA